MIVTARRASAILYTLLANRTDRRPLLLSGNVCPLVPLTCFKAGMAFEFIDLDPLTLGMDLLRAQQRVRSGAIGGVLYAHTYGDPATPVDFFSEIKSISNELLIIDDRCLCVPDMDPPEGNPADVLLYSTGYAKMVDIGSGGYAFLNTGMNYHSQMLPFSETALAELEAAYKASIAGRTTFLYKDTDWLQMAPEPDWGVLRGQIAAALPGSLAHRRVLNAIYRAQLPESICLAEKFDLWRFNLRLPDKARLLKQLKDAGLFASSHYASLAGIFAAGACPQAEALHAQVVNLFNDYHYTAEMAEQTCDIIRKVL